MGMFSRIGLGIYYRIRRMKKALKNWRKFGVIIFGSILVASTLGATSGVGADPILTTVTISPTATILAQGAPKQFNAQGIDQYGQPISTGVDYVWKMVDTAAGTISTTGLFTAGQIAGKYDKAIKVTAVKGGSTKFAYATVTIQGGGNGGGEQDQLILTTVSISPTATILANGATKQFTAKAYDQKGAEITSGVSYTWKVLNAAAGTISTAGNFIAGQTAGKYTDTVKLTATKGTSTKFAYATVTVQASTTEQLVLTTVAITPTATILAKGKTQQFIPSAYDQKGNPMSGVTFTWQATAGGTISTNGLFTAGQTAGYYKDAVKLTGTKNGGTSKSAYATVTIQSGTVEQLVLTTVAISPTATILEKGKTQQFVPYAYDQKGNPMSGVTFTWQATAGGTISTNGLFTAGQTAGYYKDTVKLTGIKDGGAPKYAYATVTVQSGVITNQPPNAVIVASPTSGVTSLLVSLNAAGSTDDGAIVKYEWDYDNNGTYDFDSGNDATVTHTYTIGTWSPKVRVTDNGGLTDTATAAAITVEEADEQQLNYVVVDPPITYLDFYEHQQFTATTYDQNDNPIPNGQVTYYWDVIDGGGTINSGSGYFTAGDLAGTFDHTVRVRATINGNTRSARATVVVNPIITQAVLDRVEILPPSVTIDRYEDYDFAAYAYDTNNAQMYSDVTYTWAVTSGPGSVNQNGIYTATGSTNTATVRVEARQGSIRVYDEAYVYISGDDSCSGILDRVEITPQTGYVQTGHSIDFDALAYDTTGCVVDADLDFWLDSNVPGTISDSGYFTANYTTGTYNDNVRVRAYYDGVNVSDRATVVINTGGNNDQNYYIDASLHAYDETIGSDYRAEEGDTVLYTLKLTNNRNSVLTNAKVTMEVPDYTTFVSVSANSGIPSIYSRTVTWELGSLYAGETKTMWLRVRVKESVPIYTTIRGKAFVKAYEISNGFWVYSSDLPVNGTGTGPLEPLTPTGAMEWILAAITALLATIFTRQLIKTRQLLGSPLGADRRP